MHFVAPNTDGDEDDLVEVAEGEEEAAAEGPSLETSEEQSEPSVRQQQDHGHSYHLSAETIDNSSLTAYSEPTYGSVSIPSFDSTSDIPAIRDTLSNDITPAYIAPNSEHNAISQLKRTTSASDVLSASSFTGWHAGPTSNPRSSPLITKKSPLESIHNISPFANSTFSPNSSLSLCWPTTNAYEASLLHHYIVHCTGWIDVCDPKRHFEKEVPRRAVHFPIILNGILGLAARHVWLMGKVAVDHSQPYVDQCLQALIVALEDPLAHWDENFLVAVILLRLHEEMGDADEQCHHLGTYVLDRPQEKVKWLSYRYSQAAKPSDSLVRLI